MTRKEHLDWCKKRALEYVDAGDLTQAFTSFASDVNKEPETTDVAKLITTLGMPLLMMGALNTAREMRHHIEGYN